MHVDQLYKCWSNYRSNAQQEQVEQALHGMATESTMRATDLNMIEYSRLSLEAVSEFPHVWHEFVSRVNQVKYRVTFPIVTVQ